MSKLNKSQQQAVEYVGGPLLIVAGAGTGKTTVITKKIAYLIEQKLAKPEEILALTFTDKAAEEMLTRVDEELDMGYAEMQISTFHAFCQRILELYGLDAGLPNQFKLLTQTDAWLLIKKNFDKFNLDYYRPLGNPSKHIHELIRHFSKCKDELISPEEYLKYAENVKLDKDLSPSFQEGVPRRGEGVAGAKRRQTPPSFASAQDTSSWKEEDSDMNRLTETANAYHTYNQLLLDNNCLDFGDLIYYTVKLLEKRPQILKALQDRYKYILVDEFQDVNWSQYYLVRLLATGQLTVVGDDDQSIYAFRGASVSNIMRFKEDYKKAKEIVLTENYRSGQEILDLAYKSIQNNNPDRLETKLKIKKNLKSSILNFQSKIEHLHLPTLEEEVHSVVEKIREIHEGKLVPSGAEGSVVWDDIAILVRANSHAEPFISALERAGIPYEFLASSGLYRQPIVLDCVNFLRVVDNYHESTAVYRLLRMPFLNFKENDLQKLNYSRDKKSVSFYEAIKRAAEYGLSKEGIDVCDKLVGWIHEGMKCARFEKPGAVLLGFLEDSGYLAHITREETKGNAEIIRQIYHLKQYFDYIHKYEEVVPGAHVSDFMEHFSSVLESGDEGDMYQPSDTPDSVNIITIHRAKGLEFKYVFVVNLVEDRFPTRRRGEGIELPDALIKEKLPEGDFHTQEERRLFYVAITRAKEGLFLTSADDYGGARAKKASRFLDELGYKKHETRNKQITNSKLSRREVRDPDFTSGQVTKRKAEKSEMTHEMPKSFSFSALNSYRKCPYQYKLSYILQIPTKGSHYFSFGQSIHSTLHKFYTQVQTLNSVEQTSLFKIKDSRLKIKDGEVKVPTMDELLKMYDASWIDDWYLSKDQKDKYYKKGKDILKEFYESNKDKWTIPVALEGWFKLKIGDYFINGRIDRVDKLADGTLQIIDYKTGQAKQKVEGDDKNQLLIYQLAANSVTEYKNMGVVSNLTFFYLEDNLQISFLGDDEDLLGLKEKLLETIENIKSGNFTATPAEYICSHCDFKDICEFRKL